ncbi:MAG: archaetidylinositol phosphate synthase [Candidatus Hodarchaeota archaeon]
MVMEKLRPLANKIIIPIAEKIKNSNVSPNILTISGFFVVLAGAIYTALVGIFQLPPLLLHFSFWFLFFGSFLDVLDGAVARVTNKKTKFGGVLDSTMDRYSDGVFIFGLIIGGWLSHFGKDVGIIVGFLGLVGAIMTSYVRSRAEVEGAKMAGVGLIERGERLTIIGFGLLFESGFHQFGVFFWVFLVLTILMHFTTIQRIHHAFKVLKNEETDTESDDKVVEEPEKAGEN